uniref:dCMP deaminase n=1 Tax=Oryza meridionalis TaxID=40149 RepID=A0A0E0C848_9ORYZ
MASARDLAVASISAAVGAAAAAAALRFLSSYGASSAKQRSPPTPCAEHLAVNGCTAERPPVQSPFDPAKREGYISWDDYFMAIAFLSAERSKDPNRQVGACLVSQEGIILGIGYNGFPRGCSDNKLPWAKKSAKGDPLETKYPYVVHAEVNAILNTNHASAAGQKLYVTMFPCNECAKIIIQSGVSEVIYFVEKRIDNSDYVYVASHKLLSMAGVKVRKHQPQMSQIPIKFQEPRNALVDMYGKCGKVSDGMHVFSKMAKRNVYTWNSIIGALALAQDGKTALQWFSRMQNDGVQPDEVTLICVLCACAHAGFVDIGRKIFNLAIQVIWGLLLRGCRARGDSWLSEHVTMRLVELEPENASHYVLLSNLYAETGRWQEAQGILHWMKKKGLRKDAGWSLQMLEDKSKKYTTDGYLLEYNMAPPTPRLVVPIDVSKKPWEQKVPLHNRWHPDIPPVADVTEGELFRVEMVDWTGGRVSDDNSADDIKFLDLTIICNLGPLPGDEWGYTAIFERENGGGFLTDHFPSARKAIWYFEGIYAYSPQIPGVRFPGLTHPGIVGTAPSAELLNIWNEREKILAETNHESIKICEVLHQRPLANLPTPENCLLGKIQEGTADWQKIANEAARTIPGRENGGNCDIKNLSRGSKVYLPVFVDGANLSTGDMHFSQGDGEVSFCGAIEMSGFLELKCEIIRGGMKEYLTPIGPTPLHVNPIFDIGPVEPRFSDWLVFEGISVDESGKQHFLDASVAYKRAVLNAIEYLSRFGYSKEQVYLLLSCCPCEGRISGIVDSPNAVATLAIPTAIFDQDVKPKRLSGKQGPKLRRLPDVLRCSSDGHLPVTQDPSGTKVASTVAGSQENVPIKGMVRKRTQLDG